MTATHYEMLTCAERELTFRRRVYPRLIRKEKMSIADADYELKMMEAIAEHFRELARKDEPQLFDVPQNGSVENA
jgi:hypothetical protein